MIHDPYFIEEPKLCDPSFEQQLAIFELNQVRAIVPS